MGIAVIDKGWHFEWPARSYFPFAGKPDGTMVWFVVRDYVVYFCKNQDLSYINHVSSTVAAAKRRHATMGPPTETDAPAGAGQTIHRTARRSYYHLRHRRLPRERVSLRRRELANAGTSTTSRGPSGTCYCTHHLTRTAERACWGRACAPNTATAQ